MFHFRNKGPSRPKGADDGFDAAEKPFLDHLEDLRNMFVKMLLTMIISVIIAFVFHIQLVELIKRPMQWAGVGEQDAVSAILNIGKAQRKPRFHEGDLVLTQSGLIGNMVSEDPAAGVAHLKLAEGMVILVKTDYLLGSIPNPAGEVKPEDLRRLSTRQLLVMETLGDVWLSPHLVRFGASALANDIARQLLRMQGGGYMAGYDVTDA
jgi:hypothetical protein